MKKIDQLDEAIIHELEKDPRASYAKLAKALGVSQGTIKNRYSNLVEHNVLRIVAYKNPNLPGASMRAFIGFRIEPPKLAEALEMLVALTPVRYAAVSTGAYHIVALTEFDSRQYMLEFLTETTKKIPGLLEAQPFVLLGVAKRMGGITHTLDEMSRVDGADTV